MIERVAEPDETWLERGQVGSFERERLQKLLGLSGRFDRRIITDGFADEPAADSVDRTARELQGRLPGGLERYGPSRLGEGWIETADSCLGARSGDPLDESRETIEPRVEHEDPANLKMLLNAARASTPLGSSN